MGPLLLALVLGGCGSEPLDEVVSVDDTLEHLETLQDIADDHDGTRAAFTDGYDASVDYVADLLEDAGYEVTLHPFTVSWPTLHEAALAEVAPDTRDFEQAPEDGSGFSVWLGGAAVDVTADVVPVDLVLPPGDEANTSTSGCEASDYEDFPVGAIALVQRGTCTFSSKARLATEAGAAAMLLFNEGQPGRTERLDGASVGVGEPGVPFFSLAYDLGADLAPKAEAGTLRMRAYADVSFADVTDYNVLADTPRGDPDRTVLVGAHLDSVLAGPGINDNGSGSALVLELALKLAQSGIRPANRVRFAWWGAEELGLVGSSFYAAEYGTTEWAVFNYDMVASPNGFPLVYDADDTGPLLEDALAGWYDERGIVYGEIAPLTASDSAWWVVEGEPVGGVFTGASYVVSESEADYFGVTAGVAMDACYHQACDTVDNLDDDLLSTSLGAAAHALGLVATHPGDL